MVWHALLGTWVSNAPLAKGKTEKTRALARKRPQQVLRRHREALLTVVEVVLHDPLYRWQMSPVRAQRRQQDPAARGAEGSDGAGGARRAGGGRRGFGVGNRGGSGAPPGAGFGGEQGSAVGDRGGRAGLL